MKEGSIASSTSPINPDLPHEDETLDVLAAGGLALFQKKSGYRFSIDAYLLAAYVTEKPHAKVLEIGSGSGVIALLLAGVKELTVTGVEVQPEAAAMSRRSVALNHLGGRVQVVTGDIRDYAGPKVAAVLANPPYRPVGTGRINPEGGKATARHELRLDLDTLLERAAAQLPRLGRFYCVYPAWRLVDLLSAMRAHGLEPKHLVMVHSSPTSPAERCLVTGVRGGGRELKAGAPLAVYDGAGVYTPAMQDVFRRLVIENSI